LKQAGGATAARIPPSLSITAFYLKIDDEVAGRQAAADQQLAQIRGRPFTTVPAAPVSARTDLSEGWLRSPSAKPAADAGMPQTTIGDNRVSVNLRYRAG
jgi:hypothetical protein